MGLESDPNTITTSDPDGHHSNLVANGELILGKPTALTSIALSSVNEKQKRRIKSVLPDAYSSNQSAASSTPLEENLGNRASRGEQRNSAYEAI